MQSLTVDIDEYDKKTELFTNQGTVNHFEKSNLRMVNNQYSQRQENWLSTKAIIRRKLFLVGQFGD